MDLSFCLGEELLRTLYGGGEAWRRAAAAAHTAPVLGSSSQTKSCSLSLTPAVDGSSCRPPAADPAPPPPLPASSLLLPRDESSNESSPLSVDCQFLLQGHHLEAPQPGG